MVDQASSSSAPSDDSAPNNDSSSCPSSSDDDNDDDNEQQTNQTRPQHDEASTSGSDDYDDESDQNSDDEDGEGGEDDGDRDGAPAITNFDDLPTDDSEEDNGNSDDGSDSSDDENEADPEDVPLAERVASRARLGRRYFTGDKEEGTSNIQQYVDDGGGGGKRKRAERKSRAIQMASERLKQARKEKGNKLPSSNDNSNPNSVEESKNGNDEPAPRKKSKNVPTEMSSKRRDHFSRLGIKKPDLNSSGIGVSIGAHKYKARDPRMVSLSGHLNEDTFEKRFDFLDEIQVKEIQQLKLRLAAWKTVGKRGQKQRRKLGMIQGNGSLEEDQEQLTHLSQQQSERHRSQAARAAKTTVKQRLQSAIASGTGGAYYPKRKEMRKMEMEAKFEELRKRGGDVAVDRAIKNRNKKNLEKENKALPPKKTLGK